MIIEGDAKQVTNANLAKGRGGGIACLAIWWMTFFFVVIISRIGILTICIVRRIELYMDY
jgi:hypothetical protein